MKVRKNKQEDPKKKKKSAISGAKRKLMLQKANPYTPTPKELEELSPLMLQIKKKDAEMRMQKNKERIQAYEDSLTKAQNAQYLIDKYDELLKKHKIGDASGYEHDPFSSGFNPFSKNKTYDNEYVKNFISDYEPYEKVLLNSGLDFDTRLIYTNRPFLSKGDLKNAQYVFKPVQFPYPKVEVVEEDVINKDVSQVGKKTTKPIEKRPVEEKINLPYKSIGGEEKRDIKRRIEPAISKLSYNASGTKVFVEFSDGTKRTMTKPEFARWKKSSPVNEERVQKVRMSR